MSVPLATVPRGVVRVGQRSVAVVEPLPLTIVRSGRTLVRQGEAGAGPWLVFSGVLRAPPVPPDRRQLGVGLLRPGGGARRPPGAGAGPPVLEPRPARP